MLLINLNTAALANFLPFMGTLMSKIQIRRPRGVVKNVPVVYKN